MELLPLETEAEINTVWDKHVPIVKQGLNYNVYLTNNIDYPEMYNELVYVLNTAATYETVTIHINNGGGSIDSAFFIIDAIKNSKARTIAKLSGTVASAATIITLACDEVVCGKYLSFMVHNYSSGMQGKGHELKAYQQFMDKELERAFREIYFGFLTDEEMTKVIEGADKWLNEDEVMERLQHRAELCAKS